MLCTGLSPLDIDLTIFHNVSYGGEIMTVSEDDKVRVTTYLPKKELERARDFAQHTRAKLAWVIGDMVTGSLDAWENRHGPIPARQHELRPGRPLRGTGARSEFDVGLGEDEPLPDVEMEWGGSRAEAIGKCLEAEISSRWSHPNQAGEWFFDFGDLFNLSDSIDSHLRDWQSMGRSIFELVHLLDLQYMIVNILKSAYPDDVGSSEAMVVRLTITKAPASMPSRARFIASNGERK